MTTINTPPTRKNNDQIKLVQSLASKAAEKHSINLKVDQYRYVGSGEFLFGDPLSGSVVLVTEKGASLVSCH